MGVWGRSLARTSSPDGGRFPSAPQPKVTLNIEDEITRICLPGPIPDFFLLRWAGERIISLELNSSPCAPCPMDAPFPARGPAPELKSCWECLRRQLDCDATHPTCRRCVAAGLVCPGYADAKPLKWLAPGRVKARAGRKSSAAKRSPSAAPAARDESGSPRPRDRRNEVLSKGPSPCSQSTRRHASSTGPRPTGDLFPVPQAEPKTETSAIFQALSYCASPYLLLASQQGPAY